MARIRRWRCAAAWVLGFVACGLPAVLAAQPAPPTSFVPVSPDQLGREALPAAPLVYGAYAFVWIALLVYVLTLWRRVSRVERELVGLLKQQTGRPRT